MQIEGTDRRLPVYLLIDVSGSMSGAPIDAVNMGLREFESALKGNPHAKETAHVSVITFSDSAQVVTPLTEVVQFSAPALTAGGTTALGAALKLLGDCMDKDLRVKDANNPGDWKPLIFLLTDGEPTDGWRPEVAALKQRRVRKPANVIAIGCGPSVNQATLKEITESVMLMQDMSPEKFAALFKWISDSAKAASKTASQQATGGAGAQQPAQLPSPPPGFLINL